MPKSLPHHVSDNPRSAPYSTTSAGQGPTSSRDQLSLIKCKRCRKDKKKCEPTNRQWPEKCKRCQEDGKDCSAPMTAEAEQEAESSGYQDLKDVVTFVRLQRLETDVLNSQADWVQHCLDLHNSEFRIPRVNGRIFHERFPLGHVANTLFQHFETLLRQSDLPAAERLLLCQLNDDLATPISLIGPEGLPVEKLHSRALFSSGKLLPHDLIQIGDHSGALLLLHQGVIDHKRITSQDFATLNMLASEISCRLSNSFRSLGLTFAPEAAECLEDLDVLMLPFSMMPSIYPCIPENLYEEYFVDSMKWPWTRRFIRTFLSKGLHTGALSLNRNLFYPTNNYLINPEEEADATDTFGLSLLHAVTLSDRQSCIEAVVRSMEVWDPSRRNHVLTLSPPYARGWTALSCAAGDESGCIFTWRAVESILSASGIMICSIPGATNHEYCALASACSNGGAVTVQAFLEKSKESNEDIEGCMRWVERNVDLRRLRESASGSTPDVWDFLNRAVLPMPRADKFYEDGKVDGQNDSLAGGLSRW